ncbi:MAG: MerR family transcriptional regulator [Anaerolineales bacterium]
MFSKSPAFNLKAVLLETGLAADTLRAWERRYGLPTPNRSAGGHRLYSQYDIETIKWLIARQAEGLSISRAVEMWNEHIASGLDPLAGYTSSAFPSSQVNSSSAAPDTTLDMIRAQWITACMSFSESNAEQALNKAFSIFPVESVCMEVLQKGMSEIGGLWYENRASVQQEHFASGLAMRRIDALLSASPAPTRPQTILIGCPPGEWHTFTPLMLSLFLRRRGLNVIYLGANVPAERFEETVAKVKASLVILVAQSLTSAATLQTTAFSLLGMNIPVGYGGRIFITRNSLTEYIPGYYLGNVIDMSLDQVEKILKNKDKIKETKVVSQEYTAALHAFSSRRAHIESTIREMIPPLAVDPEHLNTGINFLGDIIVAALQFGDMDHVTNEVEWLKVLLQSHQRPAQELADFMNEYSRAVDKHINGSGTPIKAWLHAQANL